MNSKPQTRKILINAVAAKMGGALGHLKGFMNALGEIDNGWEYWLYVDPDVEVPRMTSNIHICHTSFPTTTFRLTKLDLFSGLKMKLFFRKHNETSLR